MALRKPLASLRPRWPRPALAVPGRGSAISAGNGGAQPRRRSWLVWLGVGLIGLMTLLMQFPAAWLAGWVNQATDGRLMLLSAQGTVWRGNALLQLGGGPGSRDAMVLPSRLHWRLAAGLGGLSLRLEQAGVLNQTLGLHLAWNLRQLELRPEGTAPESIRQAERRELSPQALAAGLPEGLAFGFPASESAPRLLRVQNLPPPEVMNPQTVSKAGITTADIAAGRVPPPVEGGEEIQPLSPGHGTANLGAVMPAPPHAPSPLPPAMMPGGALVQPGLGIGNNNPPPAFPGFKPVPMTPRSSENLPHADPASSAASGVDVGPGLAFNAPPGPALTNAGGPPVLAQWPAAWLQGLGAPWNTLKLTGQIRLLSTGLRWVRSDGGWRMEGSADWQALDTRSSLVPLPLGSYRLRLEPGSGSDLALRLDTLDGALRLQATGELKASGGLRLRGDARAAQGQEPALNNLLNIIGRRQGPVSLLSIG